MLTTCMWFNVQVSVGFYFMSAYSHSKNDFVDNNNIQINLELMKVLCLLPFFSLKGSEQLV